MDLKIGPALRSQKWAQFLYTLCVLSSCGSIGIANGKSNVVSTAFVPQRSSVPYPWHCQPTMNSQQKRCYSLFELSASLPFPKVKPGQQQQRKHRESRGFGTYVDDDDDDELSDVPPTTINTKVLQDLSNQGTLESAKIANDILTSLESAGDHLNVVHYALVIDAFANIGDVKSAKKLVQSMIDRWNNYESSIIPNSHCFGGLIKAHINAYTKRRNTKNKKEKQSSSSSSLVEECENILKEMSDLYIQSGKRDAMPNTVIYNLLLKALTKEAVSLESQERKKALNLNPLRISKSIHSNSNVQKSTSISQGYVDKAIDILSKMEKGYKDKNNGLLAYPKPDSYSYCTVISLLAKCVTDARGAELAESFLKKVNPFDTASYNAVILAWSNLGTRYGAERANKLLDQLELSFSTNCDDTVAGEGKVDIGSNEFTYNTIISAWVKSATLDGKYEYAAEQAELILRRGIDRCEKFQANVVSYSSIIDCWSKSGSLNGSKRAQLLLQEMEEAYKSGKNPYVKPNVISYTSCLLAYARTNSVEGAKAANELFNTMKQQYLENKDRDYKVNMISYFGVIDGWARCNSKDAGQNALHLLNELETLYREGEKDLKPDVRVYARVIAALVKSGDFNDAEKILKRMEQYANTGDEKFAFAKPNVVIYNTLINEYARRRQSKRAMNILNQMDRYDSSRKLEEDKVSADDHTLNGIIYALSMGNGKGKARKALKMLERLENSHINGSWDVKASTRSYNMVINACANSFKQDEKERAQAVDIALKVYSKLIASNHVDADRFTYISLLKVCGKLMQTNSKRRQKLVSEFFGSCCDEGLVCDDVLENYLLAASSSSIIPEIAELMKSPKQSKLRSSMLPSEWTSRARQRRQRR